MLSSYGKVKVVVDLVHGLQRQPDLLKRLTAREQQIMILVTKGLSNKQIARDIDLTEGTVKMHLHNSYVKTNAPNRTALAALVLTFRHQRQS
jgi:two-component system nitrate/nitrite response regulator NarL